MSSSPKLNIDMANLQEAIHHPSIDILQPLHVTQTTSGPMKMEAVEQLFHIMVSTNSEYYPWSIIINIL